MDHLPIFLDVKDKPVAVIGSGIAAARRAELLLRAGAKVCVFASRLTSEFEGLTTRPGFQHEVAPPSAADLGRFALCFVATSDPSCDALHGAAARAAAVPVNVADRPELCDFIMPSIVDRSPVVVAISTGGASPIFGRMLKARLETMIPAAYGSLARFVGEFRTMVANRLRSATARRRFWEDLLEGPIAEMVLAGDEATAEAMLADHLERHAEGTSRSGGEVYLVGAGPGDPDLLTLRALRLMQKADVVLYDQLVEPAILDRVRREAERIYVGKRRNHHTVPQEEIGAMLVRLARQGKRVLRLKGGDPFIFGRGGEEIETLAENQIPFQVCPGITAAAGCSAYSGIPLTHRDHAQACVFVTAQGRNGPVDLDWKVLLQPQQTVAIYMGLAHLDRMMRDFIAHGADPDRPAAVIDNGTRINQRVITGTLRTLAAKAEEAGLRGPTIIIVGTVVRLRDKLNWYAPENAEAGGVPAGSIEAHPAARSETKEWRAAC